MRLGQAISSLLGRYGIEQVFGIPGVHTLELFRDIDRSGLHVTIPRHEQGAGYMADAYARVAGKPGVCYFITGPGVTNAITPIGQAWHDSIPLLVIASTVTREQLDEHRGTLHDTPDLAEVVRPFTLFSETATSAERVAELIGEAFTRWRSERPRPVYIGIPRDLLEEEVGELPMLGPAWGAQGADPDPDPVSAAAAGAGDGEIARAIERLAAAQRPVILAGGGARHDGALLRELAERLGAPVVVTGNAKGLIPSAHPLNTGVSMPYPRTLEMVSDADVVLALGTELSDFDVLATGAEEPDYSGLIRIDIDPAARHPQQTEATIQGRVAGFLRTALETLPPGRDPELLASGARRAASARDGLAAARAADPHTPWIDAVQRALPDDVILAADSAQLAYQSHNFLELEEPGRWLAPYGYGTLGPALPMAIGAAIAAPGTPVIALAGDGSSLFTLTELATARDLGLPITYVIWNNRGYREIEVSFERVGIAPAGVATTADDLPMIAAGFGAHVDTPASPGELAEALRAALARGGLNAIVVAVPPEFRVESDTLMRKDAE